MGAWAVLVNFGSHGLIAENARWTTGTGRPVEGVVVVDNYSSDAERLSITELCTRRGWVLAPRPTNEGFAAACNVGVGVARDHGARNVLLVNPDARVPEDVVGALGRQLDAEPLTLVSPLVVTSQGATYFQGSRVDLRSGRMRGRRWADEAVEPAYVSSDWPYRDWLSGACLAFSVLLWQRAGGLDERYFLYWEDVDFSERCVRAGGRLCLRRDLQVVHDEGATHGEQGSRARSSTYYYYNCRNRLVYAAAHLPVRAVLRWVVATPAESRQILLRGGRRQLLQSPRPLLATLRGSLAGLSEVARVLPGIGRKTASSSRKRTSSAK